MTDSPSGEDAARDAVAIGSPRFAPLFDRYDARLVQELAVTQDEDDAAVIERHGFTADEARRLADDPVLKTEVAALVQELRRAGTMAKIKARFVAEDLIGKIWSKTRDNTRSIAEMLDVLKIMAKIGDLEPRDTGGKLTGAIVRVDLNFGMLGFNPPPQTIHVQTADEVEAQTAAAPEMAACLEVDARPFVEPADRAATVDESPAGSPPTISGHLATVLLGMEIEEL